MIAGQLELDFTTNVAKITTDVGRIRDHVTGSARQMSDAIGQVKHLLEGLGVGISAKQIIDFSSRTIEAIARMKDLGDVAGTTGEAMSRFEIPTRVAGSSLDQTAAAMARASKAAVEAYDANSLSAQAFAAIGISTKQLRGLAPDQLFELIARRLGEYSDGIQKNAVMQQLLGRAGAQLSGTMKEIASETELHATVSQKDADQAKALEDSWTRLKVKGDTFWRSLASDAIPILQQLTDKLAKSGGAADDAMSHVESTFKSRINAMHDAFSSLGNFGDVIMVMLGIEDPSMAAARQQANSPSLGIAGQTLVRGTIQRPTGQAGKAPPGFDPAAIAAAKAAQAEMERLRQLDLKGWVAYAQSVFDTADQLNSDMAKISQDFFDTEDKLRQKDLDGWVAFAQAQIDEYESMLKEEGDKQPSFFESQQKQWDGFLGGVDNAFRDVWGSFTNGAGNAGQAAKSALERTLFDWLYQQAEKPIILSIFGSFGDILGLNASGANVGFGNNILTQTFGSTAGGVATGALGGITIGAAANSMFGNSRNQVGMTAGGAIGGAAGAYIGMQYGSAFGPIGMVVGAIIGAALGSLIKSGGGPKTGGSSMGLFSGSGDFLSSMNVPGSDNGRFYTPSDADPALRDLLRATGRSYSTTIRALGGTGSSFGFGLGYDTDPRGTANSRVSGILTDASGKPIFSEINRDIGRDSSKLPAEMQLTLSRELLVAVQHSTLPAAIKAIVDTVNAASATQDEINSILETAQAFKSLTDSLKDINVGDVLKQASTTALDSLKGDGDALIELANNTTMTSDSLNALTQSTTQFRNAAAQLIVQLEQVKQSVDAMFGNTARNIQLSGMSPAEQYAFYQNESASLLQQALSSNDPAVIQSLSHRIDQDIEAAFALLSPEQQAAARGSFLANITRTDQLIGSHITDVQNLVAATTNPVLDRIQSIMTDAANQFTGAASTQKSASDTLAEAAGTIHDAATIDLQAARTPKVLILNGPGGSQLGVFDSGGG